MSHLLTPATASFLLRIGLGFVLVVFGVEKFTDTVAWLAFLPPWAMPFIPLAPDTFMRVIGGFEIVLGVLLVLGAWVRVVATLVALHLVGVLIALGWNDLAVRDVGLLCAALALAALGPAGCHYRIGAHATCETGHFPPSGGSGA